MGDGLEEQGDWVVPPRDSGFLNTVFMTYLTIVRAELATSWLRPLRKLRLKAMGDILGQLVKLGLEIPTGTPTGTEE